VPKTDVEEAKSTLLRKTCFATVKTVANKGAARGGAEGAQAPHLAITILMFIFLIFHQH